MRKITARGLLGGRNWVRRVGRAAVIEVLRAARAVPDALRYSTTSWWDGSPSVFGGTAERRNDRAHVTTYTAQVHRDKDCQWQTAFGASPLLEEMSLRPRVLCATHVVAPVGYVTRAAR